MNKATTDDGDAPLHAAAWQGHLHIFQQLVACGANRDTRTTNNETALELAIQFAKHDVAAWLRATAGWSPLKVAAACRLHTIAAMQLRNGSIDPDDPTTTTPAEVLAIVATTAQVPVDALPWENAPPVCNATIKLMEAATAGWSRTAHWLHHRGVRQAVLTLLLVSERLLLTLHRANVSGNSDQAEGAAADADVDNAVALGATGACADKITHAPLPQLPAGLWCEFPRFVLRSWWAVPP